ncbi:Glutathione S-transferase 2 [Marasmius sp. AFHP31]|nr:Glutathione S-transferase 2 [Marasmius sp. AFHP31]
MSDKLTLYSYPTANGVAASILLEELGIPYEVVKMSISDADIGKVHNQVKSPWYLELNPNGKIPTISHNGFSVFETSAILLYLTAEFDKENKLGFHPTQNPQEYSELLQWIFFAHGGLGPMQGQGAHFLHAKEKIPYAINRYTTETRRVYGIFEERLSKNEWLVGGKYTIADIKAVGWIRRSNLVEIDLAKDFPKLKAWVDKIEARPAVQKGLKIPE